MDLNKVLENEKKWKYFLSSIKTFRYLPTNNVTITTKHNTKSLSTEFANKLLQRKGGTIELTGKPDVLNKYKHLDIRNSERSSTRSASDHQPNLLKAETWPKSKNRSIDIDNLERESVSRVLPFDAEAPSIPISSDDDDSESLLKPYDDRKTGVDEVDEGSFFPRKRARTSNCVEDTSVYNDLSDVIPLETYFNEEKKNGTNSECIDGINTAKSDITVNGTSKTDLKSILLKSEDEVDCSIPSSILSMMERAKEIAEDSLKNDDFKSYADTVSPEADLTDLKTTKDVLNANANVKDEDIIFPNEIEKETPTCIQVAAEDFLHVNDTININRSRERHRYTPPKKGDIDKACSTWKVQDIAGYFIFDECVTRINIPDKIPSFLDDVYEFVLKDIIRRLETVKGADLTQRKRNNDSELLVRLKSITSTETGSRLILDALLIPLCSALGIQIEVDKNIDCNFLPNCRFDYCLKKGQKIIGCVEAKSIKSLSESSVAQALLQLTILQTALTTNETDSGLIDTPVFAIVTDGHRFIYIQLKGEYLGFEHDAEKLKVREIRNENDFKQIMQHISFLINGEDSQNSEVIIID